jgi:hypothetical protein
VVPAGGIDPVGSNVLFGEKMMTEEDQKTAIEALREHHKDGTGTRPVLWPYTESAMNMSSLAPTGWPASSWMLIVSRAPLLMPYPWRGCWRWLRRGGRYTLSGGGWLTEEEGEEMKDKYNKLVFRVTICLVIFLFATAFILSYEALRDLAATNGIEGKILPLLWPLGLDAFMAVASLYMLWAFINKEWEWLPLMLVMVAMGASVVFNIIHAPANDLARSVAALPPLVAFMAFEVFIIMLRHQVEQDESQDEKPQSKSKPAPKLLQCELCKATKGKDGTPFRSKQQLSGHKPHCPARNGQESITEPATEPVEEE